MRRLLSVALAALLVVPLLAAEPVAPTCAYEELDERDWGSVRPYPPAGDDRLLKGGEDEYVGFAVGQKQGAQAVVADARGLQVTRDAGCTWDEAFFFNQDNDVTGDVQQSSAVFMDVAMSDRSDGDEAIVALVYDLEYAGEARVRTLVSDDGGRTFELGGRGLPDAHLVGTDRVRCAHRDGCAIEIAPSDPDVVYVRLATSFDTQFWRSTDGGLSFTRTNAALGGLADVEGRAVASPMAFAVAHDDADTIWAGDDRSRLLATTDGGNRWNAFDLGGHIPGTLRGVVDVAMTPGPEPGDLPIVLAVVETRLENKVVDWVVVTRDNGRTFDSFRADTSRGILDVAGGATAGQFLATTSSGAWQLDLAGRTWAWLRGSSLGPLGDVHPIDGTDTVWFRGPVTLPVRGDLDFVVVERLPDDLGFSIDPFDPLDPPGDLPGRFLWDNEVIRLDVGASIDVPMTFDLPLHQTKLDVFFLFDQSGSMQEEMDALARGMARISRELQRRGKDIWVGLGGYSGGWRYQLHANLQRPGPRFQRALEGLRAGGGAETAYTALHQVATGTGLDDSGAGFGPPPGWNADWRNGAVRIVVNLTDEPLQVEASPTVEETLDALVEERIKVIGLISDANIDAEVDAQNGASLDSGIEERDSTYGPVATMARQTGAIAGPSGVDCGGDGEVDIAQGEPVACYLTPLQTTQEIEDANVVGDLAEVMVEILDGVTEFHTIEFGFDATGIIRGVEALDEVTVDIRKKQSIRLLVTVACDERRSGKVHDPLVTALAGSVHLAAARLVVACGAVALPALEAPAAAAPTAPLPAIAAAAPAPPPPAPVQAPAPAQGIAQAANPATAQAITPQIGMAAAAQQQRQAQAASIGPGGGSSSEDGLELAFSARAPRPDPGPGVVLAGAMMASAAGVVALRRRTATSAVHARVP